MIYTSLLLWSKINEKTGQNQLQKLVVRRTAILSGCWLNISHRSKSRKGVAVGVHGLNTKLFRALEASPTIFRGNSPSRLD